MFVMKIGFNEKFNRSGDRFNNDFADLFADDYPWEIEG